MTPYEPQYEENSCGFQIMCRNLATVWSSQREKRVLKYKFWGWKENTAAFFPCFGSNNGLQMPFSPHSQRIMKTPGSSVTILTMTILGCYCSQSDVRCWACSLTWSSTTASSLTQRQRASGNSPRQGWVSIYCHGINPFTQKRPIMCSMYQTPRIRNADLRSSPPDPVLLIVIYKAKLILNQSSNSETLDTYGLRCHCHNIDWDYHIPSQLKMRNVF